MGHFFRGVRFSGKIDNPPQKPRESRSNYHFSFQKESKQDKLERYREDLDNILGEHKNNNIKKKD